MRNIQQKMHDQRLDSHPLLPMLDHDFDDDDNVIQFPKQEEGYNHD